MRQIACPGRPVRALSAPRAANGRPMRALSASRAANCVPRAPRAANCVPRAPRAAIACPGRPVRTIHPTGVYIPHELWDENGHSSGVKPEKRHSGPRRRLAGGSPEKPPPMAGRGVPAMAPWSRGAARGVGASVPWAPRALMPLLPSP